MNATIEQLTKLHEAGCLTRRDLVLSLLTLSAGAILPRGAVAEPAPMLIQPVALNSFTLNVTDLKRSVDFYQGLFGMPIQAYQGTSPCLRIGDGPVFVKLVQTVKPSFGHFCISVEKFDPDRLKRIFTKAGVKAEIRMRNEVEGGGGPGAPLGTPEVFFTDLDGLMVQVQDGRYAGGAGKYGEVVKLQPLSGKAANAPLPARTLNHVTVDFVDVHKAEAFYQSLFVMPVVVFQDYVPVLGLGTPPMPVLGVMDGRAGHLGINHFCLGIDNFEPEKVMQALIDNGLKPVSGFNRPTDTPRTRTVSLSFRQPNEYGGGPGAPMGTPTIAITDPDGLTVQIQDVKFCAGGGRLGEVCPKDAMAAGGQIK